jgi:hypothetical protein
VTLLDAGLLALAIIACLFAFREHVRRQNQLPDPPRAITPQDWGKR